MFSGACSNPRSMSDIDSDSCVLSILLSGCSASVCLESFLSLPDERDTVLHYGWALNVTIVLCLSVLEVNPTPLGKLAPLQSIVDLVLCAMRFIFAYIIVSGSVFECMNVIKYWHANFWSDWNADIFHDLCEHVFVPLFVCVCCSFIGSFNVISCQGGATPEEQH